MWMATPEEMSLANLKIRAVVATLPATPQGAKAGTPRWQQLEALPVNAATVTGSTMATSTSGVGGYPSSPTQAVRSSATTAWTGLSLLFVALAQ